MKEKQKIELWIELGQEEAGIELINGSIEPAPNLFGGGDSRKAPDKDVHAECMQGCNLLRTRAHILGVSDIWQEWRQDRIPQLAQARSWHKAVRKKSAAKLMKVQIRCNAAEDFNIYDVVLGKEVKVMSIIKNAHNISAGSEEEAKNELKESLNDLNALYNIAHGV